MLNNNHAYIICTSNKYEKLESRYFNTKKEALNAILKTLELAEIRDILREEISVCSTSKYLNNKKSLALKLIDKIPSKNLNKHHYV